MFVSIGKAKNWRSASVKTHANRDPVLVMPDGTRETWTRAPAE
jgi:hypothetical protein